MILKSISVNLSLDIPLNFKTLILNMILSKILKDSITETGERLTTFELEFPRFILPEFNTHRILSKNVASSRAIPTITMIKMVWDNPACPVRFGKNQSGMQSKEDLVGIKHAISKFLWHASGKVACVFAWGLYKSNCHKQIANRIIEPWSHVKVVTTATEWGNYFNLRNHPDAQPEIQELARIMQWDYDASTPTILKQGEWHLPYIDDYKVVSDDECVFEFNEINLSDAIKLSSSLCAQVSFRKSNESIEKACSIYDRLILSKPAHFSPFEHQATPIIKSEEFDQDGVTHKDCNGNLWSGNLKGWIQNRQLLYKQLCLDYMTCIPTTKEND